MDPVQAGLIGVVAPSVAATALILLLRRPWGSANAAPWATGLALAVAYGVAFALILGWPSLPPIDMTHATPWLVIPAVGIAFLPLRVAKGRALATAALGLLNAAMLLGPLAGRSFDATELVLHALLIAASFAALQTGIERATAELDPRAGVLAALTLVSGAAAAILLSDIASLAQVTGGLAAGLGALFALGLWRPELARVTHAAPVIATVVGGTLWGAVLYANGRYEVAVLLAITPLVLWALRSTLARPRRLLARLAVPALIALVPVGAAAGLAASAYFADSSEQVAPATDGSAPADDGYDPNYGY
ncbi:MAG: hypothetical protein EP329_17460 [Deltaproteobacteria bacterium]|nr:MAG: hypothetical protein EP329_17460 [Deltaproteobacteria bacterium]